MTDQLRAAAGISCFELKNPEQLYGMPNKGDCSTNGDGSNRQFRLTGRSNECTAEIEEGMCGLSKTLLKCVERLKK